MAADTPVADEEDDPDPLLRPAWEATPDETDADLQRPRQAAPPVIGPDPLLLATLADASEALARLDARIAAADDAVRDGLLSRLALTEAAGWLAHARTWVHPLDLALRDAGLTAPAALAALGAGARALPHTLAHPVGSRAWDDPPLDTLPDTDQAIADALALARLLRRLPGGGPHPCASAASATATLALLGADVDQDRLLTWWDRHAPTAAPGRRFGGRGREGRVPLPPLLAGAQAAQAWMEGGITDRPDPAQALLVAFGRLTGQPPVRAVFVPLWSATPAVGFGDHDALPVLRSDAADRIGALGAMVTWPAAGLHLIAESARMALRDLDRLEAAAQKGRAALAGIDGRSRLLDTLDALLRAPVVTPKTLAAKLRVAPQTATALLRALRAQGVVQEATGRARFRAFAL